MSLYKSISALFRLLSILLEGALSSLRAYQAHGAVVALLLGYLLWTFLVLPSINANIYSLATVSRVSDGAVFGGLRLADVKAASLGDDTVIYELQDGGSLLRKVAKDLPNKDSGLNPKRYLFRDCLYGVGGPKGLECRLVRDEDKAAAKASIAFVLSIRRVDVKRSISADQIQPSLLWEDVSPIPVIGSPWHFGIGLYCKLIDVGAESLVQARLQYPNAEQRWLVKSSAAMKSDYEKATSDVVFWSRLGNGLNGILQCAMGSLFLAVLLCMVARAACALLFMRAAHESRIAHGFDMLRYFGPICVKSPNGGVRDSARILMSTDEGVVRGRWQETSALFTDFCVGALPNLGFLGTVIGIAQALSIVADMLVATDAVVKSALVNRVTDALALAFDTTWVGLIFSLLASFALVLSSRLEDVMVMRLLSLQKGWMNDRQAVTTRAVQRRNRGDGGGDVDVG